MAHEYWPWSITFRALKHITKKILDYRFCFSLQQFSDTDSFSIWRRLYSQWRKNLIKFRKVYANIYSDTLKLRECNMDFQLCGSNKVRGYSAYSIAWYWSEEPIDLDFECKHNIKLHVENCASSGNRFGLLWKWNSDFYASWIYVSVLRVINVVVRTIFR